MGDRASLRVVATHNFCCAYPPSPTSYGSLPGGEGLKKAVDALREQGPTVRADAGAEWVVALLHDGVDWRFGGEGYEAHPQRFSEVCRPWAHAVDAIFASHTLGRWVGRVEGIPVVQPWPFGSELGVVEFARGEDPRAYCVTPKTGGRWGGAGSELLDETSTRVLGELVEPLSSRSGGPAPLADFFARALRQQTGAHAAAVDMLASQPPVDGVLSYLPSGPVSEADVLRLYPWPDATVVGEMEAEELRTVAHAPWPWPWSVWGFDAPDPLGGGTATLAVLEGDAAKHVERALGRHVEWRRTGVGLREAVGRALS
jgi:2',3'-cyclic-nucleotide 2'-phosphodiesterase (5'-nucleotidase family)